MTILGTPLSDGATRVLLFGAGELGKEVVIELQRLGVETIAVDRYANAPAMQVAHRSHVIDMLDPVAIRAVVELERPHYVVPEIEAIHTATLLELESEGFTVIPTARAARLTMDREGIRRLAAETLGLPTSPYRFAGTFAEFSAAVDEIGTPCVVKPVMSSSGKGQSVVRERADVRKAWDYAQAGGRAGAGRVIVEGFVDFDFEITMLTVSMRRRAVRTRSRSVRRLAIPRSTATTASRGSPSSCRPWCSSAPRRSPRRSSQSCAASAVAAFSESSCSCAATMSFSPNSRLARTTPVSSP